MIVAGDQHTQAHTLPNGLRILTREMHQAPLVTCWLWYGVGSGDDPPGQSGLAHFVEHLWFSAPLHHTRGGLKRLVGRYGGTCNAFTSLDYTAIYVTVPAAHLDPVVGGLAALMLPAPLDPRQLEHERSIIQAERERAANAPDWQLKEATVATAFQVHPYRHRVLGTPDDLRAITGDALEYHRRAYYTPSNAILVLVGDFMTDALVQHAAHIFGFLPPAAVPARSHMIEPRQQGERRVVRTRPSAVQYVQMVYHAPACTHPDFAALLLLDAVLSGAKPISFSQGAVTERSARLSAALAETGLASTARSHYYATRDPWLFELSATVQQGATPAAVERALFREVARIQQEGVTRAEVARARKQLQAQLAYAREGLRSQAWLLGLWATLDQFTRVETLLAVTEGDIQRVAQTYLTAQNCTVGHLLASPREQAIGDSVPE